MQGFCQRRFFAGLCLLLFWQTGCAAFRPINGLPANSLPAEMKVGERSGRRTINLDLLTQPQPPAHLIDAGDVLGVYIEGILGKQSDPPPVFFPQNNDFPPSFGLPTPVRDDGTISLPMVGAVNLRGLTVAQAEEKVTQAYLKPKEFLQPGAYRVQVNLQRPRQYRVLVIRQDSRSEPQPNAFLGQMNIGTVKRGTGKIVNLPAYSNDVLNALTAADGLPGLDAENAVYVIRRRRNPRGGALEPNWPMDFDPSTLIRQNAARNDPVIRGQSPVGESDRTYLHSADMLRSSDAGRPQNPIRLAAQSALAVNSRPMDDGSRSYDSIQSTDSIEPPRIWPDRSINSSEMNPMMQRDRSDIRDQSRRSNSLFEAISLPGADVTEISGASFQSPTPINPATGAMGHMGRMQSTTIAQSPNSNASPGNGPFPSPGPVADSFAGSYPSAGNPALNYPLQNYPAQGYPAQGYPVPGYADPNFPGPNYALQGDSAPSGPMPYNSSYGPPTSGNTPPAYSNGPLNYAQPSGPTPLNPVLRFGPKADFNPGHAIVGNGPLDGRQVVRIPIRLGPGENADIRPEDVILYDGDIVFIESRETEVFYTGGLLGGGQYTLPRDYDLDILQAISLATSRSTGMVNNAIGGVSALNSDVAISPSTAIVLRKLPDGGEIPIKIDLYRARTDLSERIFIQPGDFILLQYTPLEAIGAFFERHLLETALFGLAAQQFNKTGN